MPQDPSLWQRLSPARNLALKLALISFAGSALVTLIVALSSGAALQRTLEESAKQEFEVYAEVAAARFDGIQAEGFRGIQKLAANPVFTSGVASVADRRDYLQKLMEGGSFAWLGFANAAGIVTLGTDQVLEGADVSKETWFQKGSAAPFRGAVLEQPLLANALSTKSKFVAYGIPVRDAGGQLLGVLGVQQFWLFPGSAVPEAAAKTEVSITVYLRPPKPTWLIDSRGTNGFKYTVAPKTLGKVHGSGRDNLNERDAVYGFAFNSDPEWPLMIVVRQPAAAMFGQARALQVSMLQWGLAAGVLLAVPGFLVGWRLDRKLRGMAISARRIGAGDPYSVMPELKSRDQLAETSEALTGMIASLKAGRPDDSRGT